MSAQFSRIRGLDGLRAISISLVILGHADGMRGAPEWLSHLAHPWTLDLANFGVRIFFVISGFLITTLLLSEEKKTGRVDFPQFYLRRTIRIFPAYIAYLLVVLMLSNVGLTKLSNSDWIHAVTYTTNYSTHPAWIVGHLWSLSLEEQFYLLWPLLFVLATQSRTQILVGVVVAVPLIRVLLFSMFPDYRPVIGGSFETSIDTIASGCLLALLGPSQLSKLSARGTYQMLAAIGGLIAGAAFAFTRARSGLLVGIPLLNAAACGIVLFSCTTRTSGWAAVLELAPVRYVGLLSYSLYLWQQPFFNRHSEQQWLSVPVALLLAFGCALVSYQLIERPMLRIRDRLLKSTSPAAAANSG